MSESFCSRCDGGFDPTKDFFITVNERKGPSLDFCSLVCASAYVADDE